MLLCSSVHFCAEPAKPGQELVRLTKKNKLFSIPNLTLILSGSLTVFSNVTQGIKSVSGLTRESVKFALETNFHYFSSNKQSILSISPLSKHSCPSPIHNVLTLQLDDCLSVGYDENDQGHDEHEQKVEDGVERLLPLGCVEPIGHALVEVLDEWTPVDVEYDQLKRSSFFKYLFP